MGFFLSGCMKSLSYETPVESEMDLVEIIVVAVRKIEKIHQFF